jgi:hypothetical protein
MVAQALHWLKLDRFYAEARRVLKHDGVLAASAYNLLQIEPAIDEVVNRYYYEVVRPFWPPERKLFENFAHLPFPFQEIAPPKFEMKAQCPATVRVTLGRSMPLRKNLPNEKRVKSLHSNDIPRLNGGVKIKILTVAVAVGCVLGCTSVTQQGTLTIKGTVCSCTNTQVTVQETDGKYYDIIQRTGNTIITGTCSAGQPVTVQCQSIDNQRKEGSCKTAATKSRKR